MKITLIGAGKMTKALLHAWHTTNNSTHHQFCVSARKLDHLNLLKDSYPIEISQDNKSAVLGADLVILAVRPQQLKAVLDDIKDTLETKTWVISIAAVGSIAWLEQHLVNTKIIRVLPNSAISQQLGSLALAKNHLASLADFSEIHLLLSQLGSLYEIPETQFDDFLTLSSSGLAYVLMLMKIYQESGHTLSLSPSIIEQLVQETFYAAASLSKNQDYDTLIQNIATPQGTTEAGLKALDVQILKSLLLKTFEATQHRLDAFKSELKDDA